MVGLSSFLLISYWFTRIETSLGALLALFMNRIGDIFYIIAILIAYLIFGSFDFFIINTYTNSMDLFLIFFFLAAMAKSAQLYLHLWLPYSMEGKLVNLNNININKLKMNNNRDAQGRFMKGYNTVKIVVIN